MLHYIYICLIIIRAKNKNRENDRQMWELQIRGAGGSRKAILKRLRLNKDLKEIRE